MPNGARVFIVDAQPFESSHGKEMMNVVFDFDLGAVNA